MKVIQDDIAIVGMSCLFPGAKDLSAYWENILAKRSGITHHPSPEAKALVDPDSDRFERIYNDRGGYLDTLSAFDPIEFGVMPDSLQGGDPDHFLALRLAKEALVDAGLEGDKLPRERTEVILGHGTYINVGIVNWVQHTVVLDQFADILRHVDPSYTDEELDTIWRQLKKKLPPLNAQTIPALIPNIIAGRIANRLDLMGGNYIVDAACASSLIALEHGMKDLLLDRCDVALVGGVQACVPPAVLMIFCELKAMTRQEAPRPFDKDADGTMLGEGVGMMVLKRRKEAERDGDRIYGLLKGAGLSSDGKAAGLLAPRLNGEMLAIQRAYEMAEVDPATVGLVEAHGTGIPLGDATEIHAINGILGEHNQRRNSVAVGSVKSMIGHCIPAAGLAGSIKTALALHHKILPPTLNCEEPNPDLELEKTPFYINTETRPWIHARTDAPRRAAVSSMGFGGINAHLVMEEYLPG